MGDRAGSSPVIRTDEKTCLAGCGSWSETVQVRVLLSAPNSTNPNTKPVGEGFGFVVYFDYPNFNLKKKNKLKNGSQENESKHWQYLSLGIPAL